MRTSFLLASACAIALALIPVNTSAQITIGSANEPNIGALLDLKQSANGLSQKGLMLPRVSLAGNKILTVASGDDTDQTHIGLVVYNLTTIETNADDRLCPGIHIWTGQKWDPIVPYPANTVPPSLAAPLADMTDSRDGQTYHTARFHSVKADNPYSCTPIAITIIDAGVWMTENLRYTGSLVNSNSDNYLTMQYTTPVNTGADAARIRANGKLYNWAAASAQKGGTTDGKGNVDNPPTFVANDEGHLFIGSTTQKIGQGICPNGWHLPTDAEFFMLGEALKLRPDLYSSQSAATDANVGNVMKNATQAAGTFQGTSKPSTQGGWDAYLVGFGNQSRVTGYGVSAFWWASSSFNNSNSYKRRIDDSTSSIDTSASSRNNLFSVRCKKN